MNRAINALLLGMAAYPMVCTAQTGGCDAKRTSIEREISYAQAHGNAKRVDGLETALAQMNANCTDAVLRSDAQRKVAAAEKSCRNASASCSKQRPMARARRKSPSGNTRSTRRMRSSKKFRRKRCSDWERQDASAG